MGKFLRRLAGDGHLLRLALKRGEGIAVAQVGMDKMPLAGNGVFVGEKVPAAGGRLAVRAFQNGQGIVAVAVHQAGNAGRVVGAVRLKRAGMQGLGKGLARRQALPDGVGLVAVGDDGRGAEDPHRGVDDQGRIGHFRGVKGLGTDAVGGLHKHPVAGIFAAAHNEIGDHSLRPVGRAAQYDAPAGIGIGAQ